MEQRGFHEERTREIGVGSEDETRELETTDGVASYVDTAVHAGTVSEENAPAMEIVVDEELLVPERLPIRANPVSAYLAGLAESSRRPMRTNLETIARLASDDRVSAMEFTWWRLRYEHTSLIRSTLAASYAPATANLMLSAMRGVLKACFRLGYMTADDLQRASDVSPARGSRLPPAAPSSAASSTPSSAYATKISRARAAPGTRRSSPCSTRVA